MRWALKNLVKNSKSYINKTRIYIFIKWKFFIFYYYSIFFFCPLIYLLSILKVLNLYIECDLGLELMLAKCLTHASF